MTKYHGNDPHNATEEEMFGTEEEHAADYYCDQAEDALRVQMDAINEALALANAGYELEHVHAPGQGDIFSCPACIINTNR